MLKNQGNSREILKELSECFGPSGNEHLIRELIVRKAQKLGYSPITDTTGSIYFLKKSKTSNAKKIMICSCQ